MLVPKPVTVARGEESDWPRLGGMSIPPGIGGLIVPEVDCGCSSQNEGVSIRQTKMVAQDRRLHGKIGSK